MMLAHANDDGWDEERFRALGPYDIRDKPKNFTAPIRVEIDLVTGDALLIWEEDLEIEGEKVPFALAAEATRKHQTEIGGGPGIIMQLHGLIETVWQTKELVRLGCYRLRAKDEVTKWA